VANCTTCGVELTDDNKCVCGYCSEHCKCGEPADEEVSAEETAETPVAGEEIV